MGHINKSLKQAYDTLPNNLKSSFRCRCLIGTSIPATKASKIIHCRYIFFLNFLILNFTKSHPASIPHAHLLFRVRWKPRRTCSACVKLMWAPEAAERVNMLLDVPPAAASQRRRGSVCRGTAGRCRLRWARCWLPP